MSKLTGNQWYQVRIIDYRTTPPCDRSLDVLADNPYHLQRLLRDEYLQEGEAIKAGSVVCKGSYLEWEREEAKRRQLDLFSSNDVVF